MASPPNLFARLHKWAKRQDENFLTESLAIVLEYLLVLAPDAGVRLVHRLTKGLINVDREHASGIEINPQVEVGQARPDLEIRYPHHLVWVEVKAEADLRVGQLEGYQRLLYESGVDQRRLVLLSRYPQSYEEDAARPDFEIRWYELAGWLEDEIPAATDAGEVAVYLLQQFLDFLRVRGMTLTQVSRYMPDGLRALNSLLTMLMEAAAACKVSVRKLPEWEAVGIKIDNEKFWVGINFAEPEKLWFGTRCKINPEAAHRLGAGELTEENWVPGRYRWWRGLELDSEEVHFYARTKVSQLQLLENFLRECLTQARSIEALDQSTIPEAEAEN